MMALFRYTLGGLLGSIIGWGLILGLLGGYLIPFYDNIHEQWQQWQQLLQAYPKELLVFFGDVTNIADPADYLQAEFFSWVPLLLGFFSILVGSSLLAELEELGRLDLLLAQPVSRFSFFMARYSAFLAATLAILGLTWVGFMAATPLSRYLGLGPWELLQPLVTLFAFLTLFGNLALFLSMLMPSRRVAAFLSAALLIASFFITGLGRLSSELETASRFSPYTYYQGADATHGINTTWIAGLIGAASAFLALAAWLFQRRDIRVSGEGSWPVPFARRPSLDQIQPREATRKS